MARLSVELTRYFLNDVFNDDKNITLNEILEVTGERTFGFLFILLSVPLLLPVPIPGYAAPSAAILLMLAVQLIAGAEQPWLPKKLLKRGIARSKIQRLLRTTIPWLQRIEMISQPRLTPVCTSRVGRMVIGWAIALMAISLIISMPPNNMPNNTLPAIGLFITGFGLLEDDGAISLMGVICCGLVAALKLTSS